MSRRDQLLMMIERFASGNKAEFARILSISPQNLNSWLKNGYVDIERVYNSCHGISAEWLITGKGEMLKKDRLPEVIDNGLTLIPIINTDDVMTGKWDNTYHYFLLKGDEFPYYSFITRMPCNDLALYIPFSSMIGCKVVEKDSLRKNGLYVVLTKLKGVFISEFLGEETNGGVTVYKFTSQRNGMAAERLITLPPEDISKCAEIVVSFKSHR